MTDVRLPMLSTVLWMLAACSSGGMSAGEVGVSEVAAYQDLALQVSTATASYQTSMMGEHMTPGMCPGMHDQYDQHVRPLIAQMMSSAGAMDGFMGAHHGAGAADIACNAAAMMHELDAHAGLACRDASLDGDRAEVARHVAAMSGLGDHMRERCREMQAGLDGEGWTWGGMMDGCSGGMMDAGMHDTMDGGCGMMHGCGSGTMDAGMPSDACGMMGCGGH